MVERHRVQKSIHWLQKVKTWQLVIVLILILFLTATFLRLNNTGMVQRRNAVTAADKTGNVQEISARIYDLQRWSAAHMNADSGVFYLQEQYNRDAQRAISEAANISEQSAAANAEAEAICHPQFSGWSTGYMQCFLEQLSKYPTSNELPEPKMPDPALYRYSFASPIWSPDFAGWSVVICLIITLMIAVRLVSLAILRLLLRRYYRQA